MIENFSTFKSQMALLKQKNSIKQEYKIIKERFDPKIYNVEEEELFQAGVGYCFGEWALIYNQPRSASVVTLEDSIFFILDEKIFSKTFLKCLNNSENKKKKFVLENLFPFDILNERQSSLYKNIVPINCEKNQIIFKEGDKSDKIYLIYLGTFILEKKYKHKNFSVLSLEKGCIVGLESIFEGEDSQYKCTLKLISYDDLGLIFSCSVNKLLPYIINKMKESFKKSYLVFLKASEEFYLNNINIQEKMFFKKKEKINKEKKDNDNNNNYNNNIKTSNKFLSLKNLNRDIQKPFFDKMKKNKSIKFRDSKQMKVDSFPFLLNIKTESKNKKILRKGRLKKRAVTCIKKNEKNHIKLKLGNEETDINNISKKRNKRMKTYINFTKRNKNELNINNNENIEGNEVIDNKKYIEDYKNKKKIIQKNKINELLNLNNNDSVTERMIKIGNAISTCEISNINKCNKENISNEKSSYKTIKSSYNTIVEKHINDSSNGEVNNTNRKNDFYIIKDKLIKHIKNNLGNYYLNNNGSHNKLNSKILLTKRIDRTNLNLTPIKNYKNKINVNIDKYVKYLLSNENENKYIYSKKKLNLSPLMSKESVNKSEEKKNKKNIFLKKNKIHLKTIKTRNINNINNHYEYKTINRSHLKYLNNDIFTFNSGFYNLPLMTQIYTK